MSAEVTISDLAKTVGVEVDKLLSQVKEAGLPHTAADDKISNEDKSTLLMFLQTSHGGQREASGTAPKKITLGRRTLETLKTSASHGRSKKTVNVEVRKKRTYVKRSSLKDDAPADDAAQETEAAVDARVGAADTAADTIVGTTTDTAATTDTLTDKTSVAAKDIAAAEDADTAKDSTTTKDSAIAKDSTTKDAATAKDTTPTEDSAATATPEAKAPDLSTKTLTTKVPDAEAELARAAKTGAKRKHTTKSDGPDLDEEEQAGKRIKKGKPEKRSSKRILDDDFVLEGDDPEDESPRGPRAPRASSRKVKSKRARQHAFKKPTEFIAREITIGENNLITDLASQMSVKAAAVVKVLLNMGVVATINQTVDRDTAILLIEEMGHKTRFVSESVIEEQLYEYLAAIKGKQEIARAPVVTVMGHVDHGKTSLLDYIRKSSIASGEAGGITQHIGAYHVDTDAGTISFLDTPGHAAFTAMRSRGAKATDVIVLVVAADDGVKPQTEEAVQHAKAANVPIVVAINKMDKEGADPEQVKNELSALEVIPEDWGGETQFAEVSAQTGEGIPQLLEAILLQAELLELKAFSDVPGKGVVVESRLEKGRGSVTSVLVQNGTLKAGDIVLAGHEYGKVRALVDESGQVVESVGPSIPAEILGMNGVPEAGDEFVVVDDEKKAREVAEFRRTRRRDTQPVRPAVEVDDMNNLFASLQTEQAKIFNVIIKADVRGSLEAISSALQKLGTDEVELNIISSGVGGISETDVHLAATTQAMIIGFNVRAERSAQDIIENEQLQMRYYNVIYDMIDDAKAIMSGMLAPEIREEIVGVAEVRDIFNSPKYGQIAGSMVIEGTIYRSKPIRVLRDNVVIYEGELESLRRFKDDTNEVRNGMECGIGVRNYNDVKVGDKIEVYETTEVARSL
ncbi:MAG: translation initiation factor IF-2 [Pseudohongiellaceae bacterium]